MEYKVLVIDVHELIEQDIEDINKMNEDIKNGDGEKYKEDYPYMGKRLEQKLNSLGAKGYDLYSCTQDSRNNYNVYVFKM
mgnify:CR=1 FL=1